MLPFPLSLYHRDRRRAYFLEQMPLSTAYWVYGNSNLTQIAQDLAASVKQANELTARTVMGLLLAAGTYPVCFPTCANTNVVEH